jgi:hypothetical protein
MMPSEAKVLADVSNPVSAARASTSLAAGEDARELDED